MSKTEDHASRIYLTLDGGSVKRQVLQYLMEAVVDQNVHLLGTFQLRFQDPELELIDQGPFDLTKKVKIEAEKNDGSKVTLIEGEITALEPCFAEGMVAELVVRGYDCSHRLYRESKSKTYLNKKDSDLASEIAQEVKLKPQVDPTSTVYEHIYQHNQTDLEFLMERAWRIGYECFVSEGCLYFRKPSQSQNQLELRWGDDLLSFQPRMNLAEQVDEVIVKGWDIENQAPIIGQAQKGHLYPKVGEAKNGASWANAFGNGKMVIVDQPVTSQAEANIQAAARLDEISGAFLEAEGQCFRRPDIQAGRLVTLKALGKRFSGTYWVTQATHLYSPEGLITSFAVRGARTGLLSDTLLRSSPPERWSGVVTGVVTNADDPKNWCRVKVKYPWMADSAESDWARLVVIGGGPEAGLAAVPAVGDEVLVAFVHGNFSQPCVIGGLWNGKHKVPSPTSRAAKGEKPLVRVWRSRTGHAISMHDNADNKIELQTASGYTISLDDKNKQISIEGPGKLKITMDKEITIEGKANLNIKAVGDIQVESNKSLSLKAPQLNLEGTAQATLKAATVSVEGSALTEVKGGLVKLN